MTAEPEGRVLARTQGVALLSSNSDPSSEGMRAHGGWFEEGHLYLQSPFRRELYVDAQEAQQVFAAERQAVFLRFCRALGALSIEVLRVSKSSAESARSVGVGVAKGYEAKAKMTSSQEEQFVSSLRQKDSFAGGRTDLELARSILDEVYLSTDLEFTTLLDLRSGSNPIVEREYDLTVTRSGKQQMDFAASLKVPAFAKLSVDYDTVLRVREEYQARLKIQFDRPQNKLR
ncbi:MAG: hypothetical protein U0324_17720 [Polyangiales bacterium]